MRVFIICLCFSYAISSIFNLNNNELTLYAKDTLEKTHGKIIHASVLFRHGDRTIDEDYPTDPIPDSAWPEGFGQLTMLGKQQEYKLGVWLRQRYNDSVISNGYNPKNVLVNSSDIDRCLMSAELVLAGLFPPSKEEMWNNLNLKWQPIPVHTIPNEYDNTLYQGTPCERYEEEIRLLNDSPELQALYMEHKDLFDYASSHSGYTMSPDNVFDAVKFLLRLYDVLFIESLKNLTIPFWTEKIYPEPLKSVASLRFNLLSYTHEMQRIKGGPLLGSIVKDMQMKRDVNFKQTLHLYSGHDTTISSLLCTLGVYNSIAPPYSSSVIFELRLKENNFIVTMLYRNSTTESPYILKLSDCDEICTLDDFIRLTKEKIPENWNKECEVSIFEKLYHFNSMYLIVLAFLLGIIVAYFIRVHTLRKRRYVQYETIVNDVLNYHN